MGPGRISRGLRSSNASRTSLPVEPLDVLHLLLVLDYLGGCGGGLAAHHQRVGEGPRLGEEVADVLDLYAGLFHYLPGHRLLYGLALVHESGQGGIGLEAGHAASGLAEQTLVAVGHNGNHHRVGAGEMLLVAVGALAQLPAPA